MANISKKELYDIIHRIAKSQEDTSKLYEYLLSVGVTEEEIQKIIAKLDTFISTEPQELTESQQMQARANQGLYNKRTELTNVLEWDGNTTGLYNVVGFPLYKIGEPIDKNLLIGGKVEFKTYDIVNIIPIEEVSGFMPGVYIVRHQGTPMVAIVPEDVEIYEYFWEKGLYLCKLDDYMFSRKLETKTPIFNKEVVDLIEPKFIEDIYYKENTLPESIKWDGNIEGKELFPKAETGIQIYSNFYKISDIVLQQDDLVGGLIIYEEFIGEQVREFKIQESSFGNIDYEYEGEYLELPNSYKVTVDYRDMILIVYDTINIPALSSPITPGIYFYAYIDPDTGEVTGFNKELKLLPKYQYHQIPEEYIPELSVIGKLINLHTSNKSSIVNAVNELADIIESNKLVISLSQSNAERKVIYDLVKANPRLVREMTFLNEDGFSYVINDYMFDDELTIHVLIRVVTSVINLTFVIYPDGSIDTYN